MTDRLYSQPGNARFQHVLKTFCDLGVKVAEAKFGGPKVSVDCFEPGSTYDQYFQDGNGWKFQYEQRVLDFIEDAVNTALAKRAPDG